VKNKKSKLSILSKLSSYFDSEWSFSQFRTSEKKTKVGFLPLENTLAFISSTVYSPSMFRVWLISSGLILKKVENVSKLPNITSEKIILIE
jgi:hypothetical protein